jgi:superfamily II DNA or RNA helicase
MKYFGKQRNRLKEFFLIFRLVLSIQVLRKKLLLEDIIFANIASLRNPEIFQAFPKDYFSYVIFDEFHHGAAPSYKAVVDYFKPKFMLGLTATPERTDKKDVIQLLNNNLVFQSPLLMQFDGAFLSFYLLWTI